MKTKKFITKPLSVLLSVLMVTALFVAFPLTTHAATVTTSNGNFTFTFTVSSGVATVTKCVRKSGYTGTNVATPSVADFASAGYSVTKAIFTKNSNLFSGVTWITGINFCSNVELNNQACQGCTGLTQITFSDDAIMNKQAFLNCAKLGRVNCNDNSVFIGNNVFQGCTKLADVYNTDNITYIGNAAFEYCSALNTIDLSSMTKLTTIGNYAFGAVGSGFGNPTIPASVTSIGICPFNNNSSITSISVASGNSKYCSVNGILYNKSKTELIECPVGKTGSFTVPSTVTQINNRAFAYTHLTSIDVPSSVATIQTRAFAYSTCLTSVTIRNKNVAFSEQTDLDIFNGASNVLIWGYLNSTTETYAANNSHSFAWLDTFPVTVNAGTGGSVTSSSVTSGYNSVYLPDANPSTGYVFSGWSTNSSNLTITNASSPMGGRVSAKGTGTVTANFTEPKYTVTINAGSNGSVSGGSGQTKQVGNANAVTLPDATPSNSNYVFDKWTVVSGNITIVKNQASGGTIKATGNGTIRADFKEKTYSITVQSNNTNYGTVAESSRTAGNLTSVTLPAASAKSGYHFVNWSTTSSNITITNATSYNGATIRATGTGTVTANFALTTHNVTVSAGTGGTVANSSVSANSVSTTTLPTATPNSGYRFVNWTTTSGNITISSSTSASGATVKATGTGTVTANFEEIKYTVTVSAGSHGRVSSTSNLSVGNVNNVPLPTATPDDGYYFTGWSTQGGAYVTNNTASGGTIKATDGGSVRANFSETTYAIRLEPNDTNMGWVKGYTYAYVAAGKITEVTLYEARAKDGYEFVNWTASTNNITITNPNSATGATIRATSAGTVTANFREKMHTVTVQSENTTMGTVSSGSISAGSITNRTLPTATANEGYEFVNWTVTSGTATITTNSASGGTIKASTDCTVKANFQEKMHTVTVKAGVGGSVSGGTQTKQVGSISNVTLPQATANSGYSFAGWVVTSGNITITNNAASGGTIKATADSTIYAAFTDDNFRYTYNTNNHTAIVTRFLGSNSNITIPSVCPEPDDPSHAYSVIAVNSSAISGQKSITNVSIPDTVTSIGAQAFWECTNLTSIDIPEGVTSIGDSAFSKCTNLSSITVGGSANGVGTTYKAVDGNLYKISTNELVQYAIGKSATSFSVPSNVTIIGNHSFREANNLTSITIPSSVTTVGLGAFEDCTGLTSVTVPNSVTEMSRFAFSGCTNLESAVLPTNDTFTTIPDYIFKNCSSLASLTIPKNVSTINSGTFSGCSSLTSLTMDGDHQLDSTSISYLPKTKIRNLTITGTKIKEDSFKNVFTGLTSVTVNNTVTTMESTPFSGCGTFNVTIGNGTIAANADALSGANITLNTSGEGEGTINFAGTPVVSGTLTINNGNFNYDVSQYLPSNKAIGKTGSTYTVYNPSTRDMSLNASDGRLVVMSTNTMKRSELEGVQLRSQDGTQRKAAMRFVSVVRTDLLRGAKDYGYVMARGTGDSVLASMRAHTDTITVGGSGCVKKSLKGTSNDLANTAYSSSNLNEGTYKYITAAITGMPMNGVVGARFYIERTDGTIVYADYDNNSDRVACVAMYSDILGS